MKIAVTGASGAIASHLLPLLKSQQHTVVTLVRRPSRGPSEITWTPERHELDAQQLVGCDAVIHLAGAGIADKRWDDAYKKLVKDSRVDGTTTISHALASLGDEGPRVLLSGSAVGWYGDRGDDVLTETEPSGEGYLAEVCRAWEASTKEAEQAGVRVCHLRTGIVLDKSTGALQRQLLPARLGVNGPLGNGKQYQPWVAMADEAAAMAFLLTADVEGAVNLTGPEPVTAKEVARALGRALHRPAVLPIPEIALRVVVGEFAHELLFSQRAVPAVLQKAGFVFKAPTVDAALALTL